MRVEITPEPGDPAERAAIEAALAALAERHAQPASYASRWRDAGLRENLEGESE